MKCSDAVGAATLPGAPREHTLITPLRASGFVVNVRWQRHAAGTLEKRFERNVETKLDLAHSFVEFADNDRLAQLTERDAAARAQAPCRFCQRDPARGLRIVLHRVRRMEQEQFGAAAALAVAEQPRRG